MSETTMARVRLRNFGPIEPFSMGTAQVAVGDDCIVSFDRGQDFGKVLSIGERGSQDIPDRQQVVRPCQPGDIRRIQRNDLEARKQIAPCQAEISSLKLPMKIIEAEYTFDRSKIVLYFAAAERVDFRELVRGLAGKLRMRIELRQIGVRDETKILGGIGCCGQICCCKRFLAEFHPFNVRMAKLQQLQLHPMKLSGVCGRLKCCLAYEYQGYIDMQRTVPVRGERVRTSEGTGDVVDVCLLTQRVRVRLDNEALVTAEGKDVTVVSRSKARAKVRMRRRRERARTPGRPPQPGQQEASPRERADDAGEDAAADDVMDDGAASLNEDTLEHQ